MIGGTDLATLRYSEETHWPEEPLKELKHDAAPHEWSRIMWSLWDIDSRVVVVCCGYWLFMTFCDYIILYIVHGCDCDHDMGHNEAISPSSSSRSAESAISSPCWGTLANDGCWSTLLSHTTMLYIAISCWDMLRPLSIGHRVLSALFRWLLGTP